MAKNPVLSSELQGKGFMSYQSLKVFSCFSSYDQKWKIVLRASLEALKYVLFKGALVVYRGVRDHHNL